MTDYKVTAFKILGPFTLRVDFDDGSSQVIDFWPVLKGKHYGELRDRKLFDQVTIDEQFKNLVWPNDAEFDPTTLHDWPKFEESLIKMASQWAVERYARTD